MKYNFVMSVIRRAVYLNVLLGVALLQAAHTDVLTRQQQKICAVGDTGSANTKQYQVGAAMAAYGCTDILFLGDNFYPSGVTSAHDPQWSNKFERPYAALIARGATFHVALGNHDYKGSIEAQLTYSILHTYFSLPARYHSAEMNGICYIAIDTNDLSAAQLSWLREQLGNQNCHTKIVYGHHPIESSGRHGAGDDELQQKLRPLLSQAHIYIAGHEHHYSDEGNVSTPDRGSFRQLIVGTGGANLRPTICRTRDCRAVVNDYGFLALHVGATPQATTWSFYDRDSIVVSHGGLSQ